MKIADDCVFIVDDNALVREALSCVLGEKGYLPVLLENAEELGASGGSGSGLSAARVRDGSRVAGFVGRVGFAQPGVVVWPLG